MAEQNETKKKPPLIPPNFVTLVQLKERFQREQREKEERKKQERERREREERDKQEREQREREEEEKRRQKQEEEKENQSVRRREKGKPVNRRNARSRGGDDRRYRRKETEELEAAMVCMVTAGENAVEEVENGGFKSDKRGSKIWKRKEKRGNQFASSEYEVIEGEGQATSDNRKPDQLEAATVCVVTASENAVEEGGEGLENKRKGFKSWKKKGKRKDKARAENEEVIGGGELVLPSQSVDKETAPARRDSRRRGTPRHFRSKILDESDGQLVEISEKFEDLSVNGGSRRDHRFSRDDELVLPSQGVDKETVLERRESRDKGTPRHFRPEIEDEWEGQLVEISEKLEGLSMNGGSRREHRFSRDEEVIGGEELVSPSQGVHKETVQGRRDSRRRGTPRHFRSKIEDESEDRSVEISEKVGGLSIYGGSRREHRFSRGYSDSRNSAYGRGHGRLRDFRHPWEKRNAGMVWVKKGDVGDGNAGEVHP